MGWAQKCTEPVAGQGSGIKQRKETANEEMQEKGQLTRQIEDNGKAEASQ